MSPLILVLTNGLFQAASWICYSQSNLMSLQRIFLHLECSYHRYPCDLFPLHLQIFVQGSLSQWASFKLAIWHPDLSCPPLLFPKNLEPSVYYIIYLQFAFIICCLPPAMRVKLYDGLNTASRIVSDWLIFVECMEWIDCLYFWNPTGPSSFCFPGCVIIFDCIVHCPWKVVSLDSLRWKCFSFRESLFWVSANI